MLLKRQIKKNTLKPKKELTHNVWVIIRGGSHKLHLGKGRFVEVSQYVFKKSPTFDCYKDKLSLTGRELLLFPNPYFSKPLSLEFYTFSNL